MRAYSSNDHDQMIEEIKEQSLNDDLSPLIRELEHLLHPLKENPEKNELRTFLESQPFLKIESETIDQLQKITTFGPYWGEITRYVDKIINELQTLGKKFKKIPAITEKLNQLKEAYRSLGDNKAFKAFIIKAWDKHEQNRTYILPFAKIGGIDIGERLVTGATAFEWLGVKTVWEKDGEKDGEKDVKKLRIQRENRSGNNILRIYGNNCYKHAPASSYEDAETTLPEFLFNPAMETYVNTLYRLLNRANAAPTTVIKLTLPHNSGLSQGDGISKRNYLLQVSRKINAVQLSVEDAEFSNYYSLTLASLMMRPNDGKVPNSISQQIDGKNMITYVDNDEAGFPVGVGLKKSGYQVGLKDFLFLLKQASTPYPKQFIESILKMDLIVIYFSWLLKLKSVEERYEKLLQQGIFKETEYEARLQLKLAKDELKRVLDIAIALADIFSEAKDSSKNIMPQELFAKIYSLEAEVYNAVLKRNQTLTDSYGLINERTIEDVLNKTTAEVGRIVNLAVRMYDHRENNIKYTLQEEINDLFGDEKLILAALEKCHQQSLQSILTMLSDIGYSFEGPKAQAVIFLVARKGDAACINFLSEKRVNLHLKSLESKTLLDIAYEAGKHVKEGSFEFKMWRQKIIALIKKGVAANRYAKQLHEFRLIHMPYVRLFGSEERIQLGINLEAMKKLIPEYQEAPESFYLGELIGLKLAPGWIVNFTGDKEEYTANRLTKKAKHFFAPNNDRVHKVNAAYTKHLPETWLKYSDHSFDFIVIRPTDNQGKIVYDLAVSIEDISINETSSLEENIAVLNLEALIKRIAILSLYRPVCIQADFSYQAQAIIALKVTLVAQMVSGWLQKDKLSVLRYETKEEAAQKKKQFDALMEQYEKFTPEHDAGFLHKERVKAAIEQDSGVLFRLAKKIYHQCIDKVNLLNLEQTLSDKESKQLKSAVEQACAQIKKYIKNENKNVIGIKVTDVKVSTLQKIQEYLEKYKNNFSIGEMCKLYQFLLAARSCNWLYLARITNTRLVTGNKAIGPKSVRDTFFPLITTLEKLFETLNLAKITRRHSIASKIESRPLGFDDFRIELEFPFVNPENSYEKKITKFVGTYLGDREACLRNGWNLRDIVHVDEKGNLLMMGSIPMKVAHPERDLINEGEAIKTEMKAKNPQVALKLVISTVENFEIRGHGFNENKSIALEALDILGMKSLNEYTVIQTEEWKEQNIQHIIIPIPDNTNSMDLLSEEQLNKFFEAMGALYALLVKDKNAGVYIHCKSGKGRSFSFVVTFLVLFYTDSRLPIRERVYSVLTTIHDLRPQTDSYERKHNFVEQLVIAGMNYFNFDSGISARDIADTTPLRDRRAYSSLQTVGTFARPPSLPNNSNTQTATQPSTDAQEYGNAFDVNRN